MTNDSDTQNLARERSSREQLGLLGVPPFDSIQELALLTRVRSERIALMIRYPDRFYCTYFILKKSGALRKINQPTKEVKAIQAWILRNILDKLTPSRHATAFIKGKKLSDNVNPHRNNRYFACLDIEDFFPSIGEQQIFRLFHLIGYGYNAAFILTQLCTYRESLPQGGVTSPSLSNLITSRLDRRLSGYTSLRNITYTRYADDMTFSCNNRILLNKSLNFLKTIVEDEKFIINEKKTRLMGPKIHCRVTGLVKNSSEPKFGIGYRNKRNMRAAMHALVAGRPADEKYATEESISGWLNFLKAVDKPSYDSLSAYWTKLKQKYAAQSSESM